MNLAPVMVAERGDRVCALGGTTARPVAFFVFRRENLGHSTQPGGTGCSLTQPQPASSGPIALGWRFFQKRHLISLRMVVVIGLLDRHGSLNPVRNLWKAYFPWFVGLPRAKVASRTTSLEVGPHPIHSDSICFYCFTLRAALVPALPQGKGHHGLMHSNIKPSVFFGMASAATTAWMWRLWPQESDRSNFIE